MAFHIFWLSILFFDDTSFGKNVDYNRLGDYSWSYYETNNPIFILGALIFALIMISLVFMCIISLCVAKAQQKKGAQMYSPTGDKPGKHSRNFVTNVPVKQNLKEIDFGDGKNIKKGLFQKISSINFRIYLY